MRHLQQPKRSRLCGQTCVAMIAGVSLQRALDVCSGSRTRATSEHDLRAGLLTLGFRLGQFERIGKHGGMRYPNEPALARVRFRFQDTGYHWVVLDGSNFVHDPSMKRRTTRVVFERFLRARSCRITSWAIVLVSPNGAKQEKKNGMSAMRERSDTE